MTRKATIFLLSGLLVIPTFGAGRSVLAEGAPKIAVVSVSKVFDDFVKSKQANQELQVKRNEYQAYLEVLNGTLKDLQTTVQALQKELLKEGLEAGRKQQIEEELERKRIQIQVQTNEIRSHVSNANNFINNFSSTKRGEILAEIRAEIEAVGKEKKLDFIFDVSGLTSTNVPTLVYQTGQNDLTEEIAKRLNEKAAAAAKKPAETSK
jgi:Skp family chaperone for outer membrane proteins